VTALVLGVSLFVGVHLVPILPPLRASLANRLGADPYRGLFSVVALLGLGLLIYGMRHAPFDPVYVPPTWGRDAAFAVMPVAFVLLVATYLPGHIRRRVRHPMLLSLLLWASAHLAANGDRASLVLFGGLGGFALVDLLSRAWRAPTAPRPAHGWADLVALLGGSVLYVVARHLHALAGHPVG